MEPSAVIEKERLKNEATVQYFPVGLFGSTVAFAGLALAWRQAVGLFGVSPQAWQLAGGIGWLLFIVLSMTYGIKIIRFPGRVAAEFANPVVSNFFGTFFISAVLLSSVAAPVSPSLAVGVWVTAMLTGSAFFVVLMYRLLNQQLVLLHALPPALIPGLTALNTVTTGVGLPFAWVPEIRLVLFATGLSYVLAVFILILVRLLQQEAVPQFLLPSLLLLSAPFTVGFLAYVSQTQRVDMFASCFFFFGLFLFVILCVRVFRRGLPFMVTWWGACFSLAALANAALRYATLLPSRLVGYVAAAALGALTLLIIYSCYHTIRLQVNGLLMKP